MINDYFDISKPELSVFSEEEELFKKNIFDRFGLVVLETNIGLGKIHNSISVWFDLYSYKNDKAQKLYEIIKNNGRGVSLNTSECFTPDIVDWSNQVLDEYCKAFNITMSVPTYIYMYDMFIKSLNYAYGHAIVDIRQKLGCKLHINSRYVLLWYWEGIKVVLDTEQQLNTALEVKEQLIDICFDSMKRHDTRGLLKRADVELSLGLKSNMDKIQLNDIMMIQ